MCETYAEKKAPTSPKNMEIWVHLIAMDGADPLEI